LNILRFLLKFKIIKSAFSRRLLLYLLIGAIIRVLPEFSIMTLHSFYKVTDSAFISGPSGHHSGHQGLFASFSMEKSCLIQRNLSIVQLNTLEVHSVQAGLLVTATLQTFPPPAPPLRDLPLAPNLDKLTA